MINPCEMMKNMRKERWRERVQKQTEEGIKAKMVDSSTPSSRKRPLTGNLVPTSNSFSILDNDDITARIINFGVPIVDSDLDPINLLRDLEQTRFLINQKKFLSSRYTY